MTDYDMCCLSIGTLMTRVVLVLVPLMTCVVLVLVPLVTCVVLVLIPLRGKNSFEPRPLNQILVPFKFFRTFPKNTPVIFI